MNSSSPSAQATGLAFTADSFSVALADGCTLIVPLAYFPRLLKATAAQLAKYELSGGGTAIHWDELDEDISVAGLLMGRGDRTRRSPASPETQTA